MSVLKTQYSPSHNYLIDKFYTNFEKLDQRTAKINLKSTISELTKEINTTIDIFRSRMMSSVNETLKTVNQKSELCSPITTSASLSASTASSSSTSISTAPLTLSKHDDLLITVQRSSEDTLALEFRNTRWLLNRANTLKAILPMLSVDSQLQEAAKMLTSQFTDKITFALDDDLRRTKSKMTIGQRVYFHLFLIQYLENPSAIKTDDPRYIAKAFLNQDGCYSTAEQRKLALERTCVEMAIESMNDINAKYKPINNPEIDYLPQNKCRFNKYNDDILEHINFLNSIEMTVDDHKIGDSFIRCSEVSSIYRAKTTHCVQKYSYEGAIFPVMDGLLRSWKYIG